MDLMKLSKERKHVAGLTAKDDGEKVVVAGWIYDQRDLGKIRFIFKM